jgi:hypothetical protein
METERHIITKPAHRQKLKRQNTKQTRQKNNMAGKNRYRPKRRAKTLNPEKNITFFLVVTD